MKYLSLTILLIMLLADCSHQNDASVNSENMDQDREATRIKAEIKELTEENKNLTEKIEDIRLGLQVFDISSRGIMKLIRENKFDELKSEFQIDVELSEEGSLVFPDSSGFPFPIEWASYPMNFAYFNPTNDHIQMGYHLLDETLGQGEKHEITFFYDKSQKLKSISSHTDTSNFANLAKNELVKKSESLLSSLKDHDWGELSKAAHPEGIVFSLFADLGSPYSTEVTLSKEVLVKDSEEEIIWGEDNLSGFPMVDTKNGFVNNYLFKTIFNDEVNYDTVTFDNTFFKSGGVINTIKTNFPDAKYVEYFSPPSARESDWQALRFVFREHEGEWLLYAIVRDVHSA